MTRPAGEPPALPLTRGAPRPQQTSRGRGLSAPAAPLPGGAAASKAEPSRLSWPLQRDRAQHAGLPLRGLDAQKAVSSGGAGLGRCFPGAPRPGLRGAGAGSRLGSRLGRGSVHPLRRRQWAGPLPGPSAGGGGWWRVVLASAGRSTPQRRFDPGWTPVCPVEGCEHVADSPSILRRRSNCRLFRLMRLAGTACRHLSPWTLKLRRAIRTWEQPCSRPPAWVRPRGRPITGCGSTDTGKVPFCRRRRSPHISSKAPCVAGSSQLPVGFPGTELGVGAGLATVWSPRATPMGTPAPSPDWREQRAPTCSSRSLQELAAMHCANIFGKIKSCDSNNFYL